MSITDRSEDYVMNIFERELPESLCFHDPDHTKGVVRAVQKIARHLSITEEELEILSVAAWFHDVGFVAGYQDHEQLSQKIAEDTLKTWGYDPQKIRQVSACIAATVLPQRPANLLEEIICDADLYHLAQNDYWQKNDRLRRELTSCFGHDPSLEKWYFHNLIFLKQHQYFTSYGREYLEPKKQKHLAENIKKLEILIYR